MISAEQILNSSPDAIVVCSLSGEISEWNEAAAQMFEWTRPEAIGRTPQDLYVPAELATDYENAVESIKTNGSQRGRRKLTVVTRQGSRKVVEFWFQRSSQSDESIVIGFFRELNDSAYMESRAARLQLESRLFEHSDSAALDEESFENALQGALDTLCEVTGWPIGHAFLAGSDDATIVSAKVWSVTVPADCLPFKSARELRSLNDETDFAHSVWRSGKPAWRLLEDRAGGEEYRRLPDGIVSQYCLPVKSEQRVIAVLEFFSRLSKPPNKGVEDLIKRLSRTLGHIIERAEWQEDRQSLAAIVESSYDAIIGKDVNGLITSWNVGAERLYGRSAEEMLGQTARGLLPANLDKEEAKIQAAVQAGERLEQFETKRIRRNGDIVFVSLTVSPVQNRSGRVIGSAQIERDITRRKKNQLRLQEAIVTAEQANLAKSEFLANISHELRTPMNAILGMTELALQDDIPELVRDYLVTAKDSADTMLFLINDILDFSRLEAGRFELDPVSFDVRRMLEETMRTLSLRAHEKGLELIGCVDPDVPFRVVGDSMRLRQVLTNLVGNAIKFTETGEVLVSIDVEDQDNAASDSEWAAGDSVVLKFRVTDTGIGISSVDQERIFSPFTQADASSTRTYAGTGLGLSICVELSRLMNGDLSVESEPGKGSVFSFTAGLEVAPVSDEEFHAASVELKELQDAKVLVVDDNETTRTILKEMLEVWSVKATTVSNAESAVSELQRANDDGEEFTVMLVDAVMPETDGIGLIEQMESTTEGAVSTILMLASADQHLFRSRAEHLSVDAFLEKPVSQSNLLNALGEAVGANFAVQSSPASISQIARRLQILVADDIAANQKVVTAILNKRGHDVMIAHNGREAIDLYQRGGFHAILMDVQMPIMDGLQATTTIRNLEESTKQHIPIIAMTAHALRGDREACLNAGMDAYVSKPLNAELLLKTIEDLATSDSSVAAEESHNATPSNPASARKNCNTPPIWVESIALSRMGDDVDLLKSMVGYFFEDIPDLLTKLKTALADQQAEEAKRLCHSIKGLCANFESATATALAEECESLCRANKLSPVKEQLSKLESAMAELNSSLQAWLSIPR